MDGDHGPGAGRSEEVDAVDDIDIACDEAPTGKAPEAPRLLCEAGWNAKTPNRNLDAGRSASAGEQPALHIDVVAGHKFVEKGAGVLVDACRGPEEWGEIESDAHNALKVAPEQSFGWLACPQ